MCHPHKVIFYYFGIGDSIDVALVCNDEKMWANIVNFSTWSSPEVSSSQESVNVAFDLLMLLLLMMMITCRLKLCLKKEL